MCCFFFSSRRRHTRSLCDWSSDVCSSDLRDARCAHERSAAGTFRHRDRGDRVMSTGAATLLEMKAVDKSFRSEERRVGKECRTRWGADHEKKKKEDVYNTDTCRRARCDYW